MLTGSHERPRIAAAVAAGAIGRTAKSTPFEDMARTVGAAARGDDVLDPDERTRLIDEHHRRSGTP